MIDGSLIDSNIQTMSLAASEMILNPDGSVFHLSIPLQTELDTVFLVGDPGRVPMVSQHFSYISSRHEHREFISHIGKIGERPVAVVSTGIGTDNIDIVLNELDIVCNVDPVRRTFKDTSISLQLIRIGTSGAFQADILPGSLVLTESAIGLDPLMHFYKTKDLQNQALLDAFIDFANIHFKLPVLPYAFSGSIELFEKLKPVADYYGTTVTLPGFYGPQGRKLRASLYDETIWQLLPAFRYLGGRITNFEMESSGIYGLSKVLGHHAMSINIILANRITGAFLQDPDTAIQHAIEKIITFLFPD